MVGASLDHPNDAIANELLVLFKEMIQNDKAYAQRLEDHYLKMKDTATEERSHINKVAAPRNRLESSGDKIGRNDPCPCNSGKRFKKCCL